MNAVVIPLPRPASPIVSVRRFEPEPAFGRLAEGSMLDLIALARIEGHVSWPRDRRARRASSSDDGRGAS